MRTMVRKCLAASLSGMFGIFLLAASARAADEVATDSGVVFKQKAAEHPSSRGAALPVLYGTLVGLQAYDGWSTVTAVKRGVVEANPAMSGVANSPGAMWAFKVGATSASIFAAETMWRRHRRAEAIATMLAVNGMMVVVAARNSSVMQRLK
jgi:hypothetical protein